MQPFMFGPLVVHVHEGDGPAAEVIRREMSAYAPAAGDTRADIELRLVPTVGRDDLRSTSPSVHMEFDDGFGGWFGRFFVARWRLHDDAVRVELAVRGGALGHVRRYRNPSFHHAYQDVGKFAHEIALVGTVQMFRPDALMFLHGAALVDPQGNGVVVGGTGGVGKTSLALELGRVHRWRFLADDMVGVDAGGTLHLNGNWPKIYAYNTLGDPELEGDLLRSRAFLNRLHWRIMKRFPSLVRRTLAPDVLYPAGIATEAPLRALYLVFRTDARVIEISRCDPVAAASACAEILAAEQSVLSQHVAWSGATRAVLGYRSVIPVWGTAPWSARFAERLVGCRCHLVRVPRGMGAVRYREAMAQRLTGGSGDEGVVSQIASGA